MVPVNRDNAPPRTVETEEKEKKEEPAEEKVQESIEPKGDPDMCPVYVKSLLPTFTTVYQSTMLSSVR